MSLPVLGVVVIAGVSLTMLLLYFAGWTKIISIQSAEQVQEAFLARYPDQKIKSVVIDDNQRSALLSLAEQDKLGLVVVIGDKLFVRLVERNFIKDVKEFSTGLVLQTHDFTCSKLTLNFTDQAGRAAIKNQIESVLS